MSDDLPVDPQGEGLARRITFIPLVLYGVGDILGAGVYGLIGKAAGEMGYAVWLAFATSMVAAGLTGLSYASLGSRYPRAGGAAYYTLRAFRKGFLAYGIGLAVLASGLTSMATATRVFAGYLHGLLSFVPIPLALLLFLLGLSGLVFWGIRESMWANSLCTVIELVGLLIVIGVGLPAWGQVNYLQGPAGLGGSGELTLQLMLTGAVLTFYSFVGFEDMANTAEEVHDVETTLPRALLTAIAIASVIYMAVSISAVSVVPPATLAQSPQPLVEVVTRALPGFPSPAFSAIALFAVANTALLNYIMGSRLIYGMAQQGLLPAILGRIHPVRRTPYVSTMTIFFLVSFLAIIGDVSSLARATSVLLLIGFTVVNLSLVILKLRPGEPAGRLEVPLGIPLAGAAVSVAMLTQAKAMELTLAGGVLLGIGLLYFLVRPRAEALDQL